MSKSVLNKIRRMIEGRHEIAIAASKPAKANNKTGFLRVLISATLQLPENP